MNQNNGGGPVDQESSKAFERRQEVIDAALREFSSKGYKGASLNNILKDAQISKGTFYYHFKSKEDLYFFLIGILIDEKKEFLKDRIKPEDFNKDIFSIFRLQAKLGVEFAINNPHINDFSKSFIKEKGSSIYDKALGRYNFKDDASIKALIDNAYAKGEIRDDMPKEFAERLIGHLFTNLVELSSAVNVEDYEKQINYLIEFMKNGLAKR